MSKIDWKSVEKETPKWFRDAKFGMFFHWGPYSVPAFKNEWYSRRMYEKGSEEYRHHVETYGKLHDFGYKDFYPMMTGEKFDPDEWAALVKRSGAKYAGPVSEHADNFAMWDSKVNPANSVNYGPKRDVVGECFKSFRKEGIKTLATFHHQWMWGWFMSSDTEADVYMPGNEKFYGPGLPIEAKRMNPYRLPDRAFCENWRDKVIEVIDKYDPDAVYFDSRTIIIDEPYRFAIPDYYYNKKGKKDGIITYKWEDFPKEAGVFDIECGRFVYPSPYPWQVDDQLEDGSNWNLVEPVKYRPASYVIRLLCDIVSKNGNLLLNVGPYADGSFHPEALRIMGEVGDWLALNGEAIYGTRPFAIASENEAAGKGKLFPDKKQAIDRQPASYKQDEYRFTTKGDDVYVLAYGWPIDGIFHIGALREGGVHEKSIGSVRMLGIGEPLTYTRDGRGLHVTAPAGQPCNHVYALKIGR